MSNPAAEKQVAVPGKIEAFKALVKASTQAIKDVAPQHLNPERLARIVMVEFQRNPALQECAPATILGGILQASALGLEVADGTQRAYLVPFFNGKKQRKEAQLLIGYRGKITLIHNTGLVKNLNAGVVRKKDTFTYELGSDAFVKHRLSEEADRGAVTHAYMVVEFINGGRQVCVITVHEVEAHRRRSKQADSGPWKNDYEAMCLKTVIHVGSKLIPASTDKAAAVHKAFGMDGRAEAGKAQDLGYLSGIDGETPTPEDAIETTAEASAGGVADAAEQARTNLNKTSQSTPAPVEGAVVEAEVEDHSGTAQDPLEDEPAAPPPPPKAAPKPAPVKPNPKRF